jgi:hypothetical protein
MGISKDMHYDMSRHKILVSRIFLCTLAADVVQIADVIDQLWVLSIIPPYPTTSTTEMFWEASELSGSWTIISGLGFIGWTFLLRWKQSADCRDILKLGEPNALKRSIVIRLDRVSWVRHGGNFYWYVRRHRGRRFPRGGAMSHFNISTIRLQDATENP